VHLEEEACDGYARQEAVAKRHGAIIRSTGLSKIVSDANADG
jgi:hypothetical protein